MKKIIYLAIVLLIGCESNNKLIYNNFATPLLDYNDTSAYRIIPLETNSESIFTSNDKTVVNDSVIAILDNEQRKIFMFDIDGTFKSKIYNIGNSENEYITIGDFTIYKDTLYLLDYTKRKILKYDYNGKYLDSDIMIDYVGMAFTKRDDYGYIFYQHFDNDKTNNSEVVDTDMKGKVKHSYFERSSNQTYPVSNCNYFSNTSKGIFLIPINRDKVYHLSSDNIVKEVFNFNISNNMRTSNDTNNKGLYSYFHGFHACENGIFVCSNSEADKLFDLFGDMNTGKYIVSNELIIKASYRNYFITTISDYSQFKKNEITKYEINTESNPAIVLIDSNYITFDR